MILHIMGWAVTGRTRILSAGKGCDTLHDRSELASSSVYFLLFLVYFFDASSWSRGTILVNEIFSCHIVRYLNVTGLSLGIVICVGSLLLHNLAEHSLTKTSPA